MSHKPSAKRSSAERKASAVSEALSKSQEARQQRREAEIKIGQEALANALTKSLVLLRFKGHCRCGLMLTERDRIPKSETYRCPQCGKSGPLVTAPAAQGN